MGHHYHLSGVDIESDLRLVSLPDAGAAPATQRLRVRVIDSAAPAPLGDVLLVREVDGVPWLSLARRDGGYLARVHGVADFTLDARGTEITCAPRDGCDLEIIEQLFIDQIFPLVLHAAGRFSFHASSVALSGFGVLAFLGATGRGKSTLASSLARAGFGAFFTDDCLAMTPSDTGVLAHPSYPSSRLWPPSAEALFRERGELPFVSPRTDKRRVALPMDHQPRPLRRVYLLEEGEGAPALLPLSRRDALAALAAHLYRLDFLDRTRLAEELAVLERVVTSAEVKRLAYRRDFMEIPAVHAVIHADTALNGESP